MMQLNISFVNLLTEMFEYHGYEGMVVIAYASPSGDVTKISLSNLNYPNFLLQLYCPRLDIKALVKDHDKTKKYCHFVKNEWDNYFIFESKNVQSK